MKLTKRLKLPSQISKRHILIAGAVVGIFGGFIISRSFALSPVGTGEGLFYADCTYSHRAPDDPIVFPEKSGASHSHDFFGAKTLDAFSTNESIRQGATSCARPNAPVKDKDRSAYWVPTMYVNDQPVQPKKVSAFYNSGVRNYEEIKSYPEGLRIIAGTSTGGPQRISTQRVWFFKCGDKKIENGSETSAPTCSTDNLELSIIFPDCWDGVNIDSPNHKSHMAYSSPVFSKADNKQVLKCPQSHPVLVPSLEMVVLYPTTGGPTTRLSSGAVNTAHADFMNGWDTENFNLLMRTCINKDLYCGGGEFPAHIPQTPRPDPNPPASSIPPTEPQPVPNPTPTPSPTPDTKKPTVSIFTPTAGTTLSGNVRIGVNASDNVAVTKVELYIDGELPGADIASPFAFIWNSARHSKGNHILTAKAYDAAGNVADSAPIPIALGDLKSAPQLGDTNNDGVIDILDLSRLAYNWCVPDGKCKKNAGKGSGDLNNNGIVNSFDLDEFAKRWERR